MESIIKWQTETPIYDGIYLITYKHYECYSKYIMCAIREGNHWYDNSYNTLKCDVLAWCPLNSIETYKGNTINLMEEIKESIDKPSYDNEKEIITVYCDDYDKFFADNYKFKDYETIIGKCFMNKHIGIAVKILLVPDDTDYNLEAYEFIYERFDKFSFGGWQIEDYNWLQERKHDMLNKYKITPYANINVASESMFHVGKNGKLYTRVDCGDDWYQLSEISNEEFEKIRNEAITNIENN